MSACLLLQVAEMQDGLMLGKAASGRLLRTYQQLGVPVLSKPQLYRWGQAISRIA